jgi:hypothetical protein
MGDCKPDFRARQRAPLGLGRIVIAPRRARQQAQSTQSTARAQIPRRISRQDSITGTLIARLVPCTGGVRTGIEIANRFGNSTLSPMPKFDAKDLIKHLSEKWGTMKPCPLCGVSKWNVTENVFELREHQQGKVVVGGASAILPVVPVTCANCGNTVFVNAIVSGIASVQQS